MRWMFQPTPELVDPDQALPGRNIPINPHPAPHAVLHTPLRGPWDTATKEVLVGVGCFWGPERIFWQMDGVISTSVGYAGGVTKNPIYREVCSGQTNHVEVVHVVFDPAMISLETIVAVGLEDHDPTQGFRQGNDVGTQYRSALYTMGDTAEDDKKAIEKIVADYGEKLRNHGYGAITTEIKTLAETDAGEFFLAEEEHQQYLHKVPGGYCPSHSTGVACGI